MILSIGLAVFAMCVWILYRRSLYTVFTEAGIPGPKPSIFFGNLAELSSRNPLVCQQEWIKKYGDVVGFYTGMHPCVLINNPDLLKKIQISEFHNFADRPNILSILPWKTENDDFGSNLGRLRGKRWKDIRSLLTPTFTTSKMKQMTPIINEAVDILMDKIDKYTSSRRSFDIYKLYQQLTLDVIARTAFGIQTDVQRNEHDLFLEASNSLFTLKFSSRLLVLVISFPEFSLVLNTLMNLYMRIINGGTDPMTDLTSISKRVVETRRQSAANRRCDVLQLMMDARATVTNVTNEELTAGDDDADEVNKTNSTNGISSSIISTKSKLQLSDKEIVDTTASFLLAGFRTTSAALAFTTHFLVHYPEIQNRIRTDVLRILEEEDKIDYSMIQQLPYLGQVINESLRMYPPVYHFVGRKVKDDLVLDGYRFKKDVTLIAPSYTLQHDDRYWDNPKVFNPERFSSENKSQNNPLAFQSFGAGPRNCIGMRFALMEVKFALIKILSKYKLEKCPDTDKLDVTLQMSKTTLTPKNGVIVRAVRI